jgi:hypothetical protein
MTSEQVIADIEETNTMKTRRERHHNKGTAVPVRFMEIDGRIRAIHAPEASQAGKLMFAETFPPEDAGDEEERAGFDESACDNNPDLC